MNLGIEIHGMFQKVPQYSMVFQHIPWGSMVQIRKYLKFWKLPELSITFCGILYTK